jgi:tellurite resistance protein TehA-like permease
MPLTPPLLIGARPEAGGAVMATGIVSVALRLHGPRGLSGALLILTAVLWALLGAALLARVRLGRERWRREASRPVALTAVAGTAVLGSRVALAGWIWAAWLLLAIAAVLLVALGGIVKLRRRAVGADFLLAVAPQSLAVLAASIAERDGLLWPALLALAPFAAGLGAYVAVVERFDLAELRAGRGDQWVAGGALAISALACAEIAHVGSVHHAWGAPALRVGSIVLWSLTVAWLIPLAGAEARWPRLRYDVRRWATVFPLGMCAVMSVATGDAASIPGFVELGHAAAWLAFAVWCVVAAGAARRGGSLARRAPPG